MTDSAPSLLAPEKPIIVAFRDQDSGPSLLRRAVRRGAGTGQHITVVHAIPDASLVVPVAFGGTPYGTLIAAARQTLDEESRKVCADYPDAHVTTNVHSGDIVEALVNLSSNASLLVVGADRVDQRNREYLGSVGQQVALGSTAPVLVIPRDEPDNHVETGAVIVGVDGSEVSYAALRVAAGEAARSGGELVVVTATTDPASAATPGDLSDHPTDGRIQALLADLSTQYPALTVSRVVDRDRSPRESLSHYSRGAGLLVIGRHGRGARPGILLGSVTHTLLLDPQCPTLVVTLH